jgi:5-formyltetrahydrofolate cyclo-ligase
MLSRRDALSAAERATGSVEIARRAAELLAHELAARAPTVALYAPKGSEVDTASLDAALRATRTRIVYPRIDNGGRELVFHVTAPAELVPGRFGLREPPPDHRTFVALLDIDAFVVPGLAFDRAGGRIGWGRGHYDATLAAAPQARRIGLAFECQLVAEVAHDPHDVRLHCVVTELDTYRTLA